jgi:adenylate/guanylate cyclase family protein/NB-ARC domain-containing protein
VRDHLPSGTVTFLFTDVEGSTSLLHKLGAGGYADALAEHRRVIREACDREGGVEVDTQGDAFFFAFPTAAGAISAAAAMCDALASGSIQVRVGVHTGAPLLTEEGYVGEDVHRAARVAAAGHGGQVLVSSSTRALVEGVELRDLGEHRFKDLTAAQRVYQLGTAVFPPLSSLYRTNLPVPATGFLGRDRELAEVVELLARDDVRLLTLVGPGGTGKTRLAVQAAAESADLFPDGVWWVSLAPLRDSADVLAKLAEALGLRDEGELQVEDTLVQALAGRRRLVLLERAGVFRALRAALPDDLQLPLPPLGRLVGGGGPHRHRLSRGIPAAKGGRHRRGQGPALALRGRNECASQSPACAVASAPSPRAVGGLVARNSGARRRRTR